MERQAVKDLMYGGMAEIIRNPKFYRHSPVGKDYCSLTEHGQQAMLEYMNSIAHIMWATEEADLDRRAKDMVMKELKS